MKKETRVTYDSVIQPQYLLITRSICFHSIFDLHATIFIQYYINILHHQNCFKVLIHIYEYIPLKYIPLLFGI